MALYLLPPMDRVLLLLLLPSTSVPPLPLFELFLCSSLVATAADDDDDVVDFEDQYDFIDKTRCVSFCCIPKSIFALSAGTIDVSNSNILTVSQNFTAEAIHGVLPLHIPVSLMMIYVMMPKKKEIRI